MIFLLNCSLLIKARIDKIYKNTIAFVLMHYMTVTIDSSAVPGAWQHSCVLAVLIFFTNWRTQFTTPLMLFFQFHSNLGSFSSCSPTDSSAGSGWLRVRYSWRNTPKAVVFQGWESQPWLLNIGHHKAIIVIPFSSIYLNNSFLIIKECNFCFIYRK